MRSTLRVARKIMQSLLLVVLVAWLLWCAAWYIAPAGKSHQHKQRTRTLKAAWHAVKIITRKIAR